ncbi:hypothetical protein MMC30_007524 [Trapelia coarctata]|nr:hypothetical protein [Trapelia coarctata]
MAPKGRPPNKKKEAKKEANPPDIASRRSNRLIEKATLSKATKSPGPQDKPDALPSKEPKSKRPNESDLDGKLESKKKKQKTAKGTAAPSVQDNPPKKPKPTPGNTVKGPASPNSPKATEAHPELSDNLRRRLCSLWRSNSNVIASLSDLQMHHSREQIEDGYDRRMLSERTIMLAIAALWQGLAGADMFYSFGNNQLFADIRIEDGLIEDNRCVPNSIILLMPLFFWNSIENPHRDDEGNLLQTGQPQHGLIAAAEKVADVNVTFTFMYSRPRDTTKLGNQREEEQDVDRALIRQTAREVVRRSGWLKDDEIPQYDNERDFWQEVSPAFADEITSDIGDKPALDSTPEQWNTMGHHMILNAWAYMLDIPLEPEIPYAMEGGFDDPFYAITDELIDLALQGRVDGDVIKQFMTEFRFAKREKDNTAVHRIKKNSSLTRLRNERSVLMNQTIFDRIIEQLQLDPPPDIIPRSRHLSATSQEPVKTPYTLIPGEDMGQATVQHDAPTWRELLEHNLTEYEKAVKKPVKGEDRLQTTEDVEFQDNVIWRSIMSVWWPLWESKHRYAFGPEDICSAMRSANFSSDTQIWAVGNRQMPFVIPMRGHGKEFTHGNESAITGKEKDKKKAAKKKARDKKKARGKGKENDKEKAEVVAHGGVGHWILVIATFDEEGNRVDIHNMNSAPWLHSEATERAAEDVCRFSGWLGIRRAKDKGYYELIPFTGTFNHISDAVPSQGDAVNCGTHVIVSAWAALLNIPIGEDSQKFRKNTRRFYLEARRVIDCALAGRMDTRTIQAFLNAYEFCVEQDVNSRDDDVVTVNVMPDVSSTACNTAADYGFMAMGIE